LERLAMKAGLFIHPCTQRLLAEFGKPGMRGKRVHRHQCAREHERRVAIAHDAVATVRGAFLDLLDHAQAEAAPAPTAPAPRTRSRGCAASGSVGASVRANTSGASPSHMTMSRRCAAPSCTSSITRRLKPRTHRLRTRAVSDPVSPSHERNAAGASVRDASGCHLPELPFMIPSSTKWPGLKKDLQDC